MRNWNRMLEGKRCVITSGAHGMGFSIARLFARHGAIVAICGRDPAGAQSAEKLKRLSPDSFFVRCDLSDPREVRAFADTVLEKMGTVDVLVNNAGINRKEPVDGISEESFQAVQAVNLYPARYLTKRFLPGMKAQRSGSIVNISSMNALAPTPTTGSYVMSKGAVNALTKVTAVEAGPWNVRCNAIAPGWVATTYLRADIRNAGGGMDGCMKALEFLDGSAPLISPALGENIANHALFLASDLSSYITGAVIRADGGAVLQEHPENYPAPAESTELRKAQYAAILEEMAAAEGE